MTRNATVAILIVLIFGSSLAASAASKETIELQEEVKVLANRIASMQQSFDEKLAALQANADQTANSVKQISTWAAHVDATLKQQTADSDTCADQISGNSKMLRDQLQDLRARLDAIAKQLREVNAPPANSSPAAAPNTGGNSSVGKEPSASGAAPR